MAINSPASKYPAHTKATDHGRRYKASRGLGGWSNCNNLERLFCKSMDSPCNLSTSRGGLFFHPSGGTSPPIFFANFGSIQPDITGDSSPSISPGIEQMAAKTSNDFDSPALSSNPRSQNPSLYHINRTRTRRGCQERQCNPPVTTRLLAPPPIAAGLEKTLMAD